MLFFPTPQIEKEEEEEDVSNQMVLSSHYCALYYNLLQDKLNIFTANLDTKVKNKMPFYKLWYTWKFLE